MSQALVLLKPGTLEITSCPRIQIAVRRLDCAFADGLNPG